MYTVEPLYCGHHWEPSNYPDCKLRGSFSPTIGTKASVHIREVSTVRGSTVHTIRIDKRVS